MASVKVFPRLDKANSEGKVPIYLRVTKNRKSKYIALDAYIFSKDWSKETCRVRAGLDKHISFHSARHSWAVRALQREVCVLNTSHD